MLYFDKSSCLLQCMKFHVRATIYHGNYFLLVYQFFSSLYISIIVYICFAGYVSFLKPRPRHTTKWIQIHLMTDIQVCLFIRDLVLKPLSHLQIYAFLTQFLYATMISTGFNNYSNFIYRDSTYPQMF